jgi:hypothetical protein
MGKVLRLTESDLTRIVKRVIKENHWEKYGFNDENLYYEEYEKADKYASDLYMDIDERITKLMGYALSSVLESINDIINENQNEFREEYGQFVDNEEDVYNESINDLMKMSLDKIDIDEVSFGMSEVVLEALLKNEN